MEDVPNDMWSPYKQLSRIIQRTLTFPNEVSLHDLEMHLRKYKQNLSSILKNPPKNESHRKQLLSSIIDGIMLCGQNRKILLSKDLVDESIIISDMFDLDEFHALELLCTAQRQRSQHPNLPRGLIAVLLYYDGRRALSFALRDLFQITNGISWVTDVPKEIGLLVTNYTQALVDDYDVIGRIIELLECLDISKEIALLTKNRALGNKKHQNQIQNLYEEIRLGLASALFNWSAQKGLAKIHIVKLIRFLSRSKSMDGSAVIDDVMLTILMAVLFSFDTSILRMEEDYTQYFQKIPILNDTEYLEFVYHSIFTDQSTEIQYGISSVFKLAFGLTLSSLRHSTGHIQTIHSKVIEKDELCIDEALNSKVFEYLFYYILDQKSIFKNDFFYRRMHILFTDFIYYMHSKITELRGKADDTARTVSNFLKEGLEPPTNLDHNFEMLLLCIGKFYKDNRAGLSLCVEYWGSFDYTFHSKTTSRSVSLFKFVRLAGELLPTALFVPYLKMIAGLTSTERSARSAFNMLKQQSGLSGSVTLSWEHFFGSLARYYGYLRQDQIPGIDTIYKTRVFNRNINPQEVEGIHAVLDVIRSIATYDEIARIAICEHPNWTPIQVLLGLLTCSIPLSLKADVVRTLAALSLSKETALSIWNNLEASQIIATIPTTNAYNICNLEMEINQNECRNERYPLSQAILELFYTLMTTACPGNLGNGTRKTGLEPYMKFIINGIFLKSYNRAYKVPSEKWEIVEKCLKLFSYLLSTYEIKLEDFDETSEHNPPPGYNIMLQLQTKSDMLKLILLIIDEARIKLMEYNNFPGKEILETSVLHCLSLLENGLTKLLVFFDMHSIANSSYMLSGLNKLLLNINPRTKQPDYLLNILQFVTFSSWLPEQCLTAINIVHLVTDHPTVTTHIWELIANNECIQNEIRQGFVECLDGDFIYPISDASYENKEVKLEIEIKESILKFLQIGLLQTTPNIVHFLLGFDLNRESTTGTIQIIESSNHCLKSVIALLDAHLEIKKNLTTYNVHIEKIIESAYYLLYCLCSNQRTCETVLRYLRSFDDFLYRHLNGISSAAHDEFHLLNQKCYLLKCTAIELRLTSFSGHISRFQCLCDLFFGVSIKNTADNLPVDITDLYFNLSSNMVDKSLKLNKADHVSNFFLCNMLNDIDFEIENEKSSKWDFFDNSLIEQVFTNCEIKAKIGVRLINVKKLHQILNDELLSVQSTIASGQRNHIQEEIKSIIAFALASNNNRNKKHATIKLIEAWSEVCEIIVSCSWESSMPLHVKQEFILEILQKILSKIVPIQPILDISILTSGTVLLLLVNLRYISMKYDKILAPEDDILLATQKIFASKSNILSLKFIFKNILEWIIISSVSSQKLRVNLYAALLNCMRIIREYDNKFNQNIELNILDKPKSITSSVFKHKVIFMDVLQSYGDKVFDIICHDCIAGHEICRMSALSCIDSFLELDGMSSFINLISNRGYLTHIITSLMKSDGDLCESFQTSLDIKAIYVYESTLAMLIKIANCQLGAELLLSVKILNVLSNMKVFDMHADSSENFSMDYDKEFIPTIYARFRQILFPAISLCDTILCTLGVENHSAIVHIMGFILSHMDMIECVLRSGKPVSNLGLLEELCIITGLIARSINQEMYSIGDTYNNLNASASLCRLHYLMISLLPRFIVKDSHFKNISTNEDDAVMIGKQKKYCLQIAANVVMYCRNAIANHCVDHRANIIIFSPNLSDLFKRDEIQNNTAKLNQSISLLINQLKGCVEYYCSQENVAENVSQKNNTLSNNQLHNMNYMEVTETQLSLCTFITEQCLYLLWIHLDFYVRHINSSQMMSFYKYQINSQGNEIGNSFRISVEDVNNLKKMLISIFNETFCKQLISTCAFESDVQKGFNQALLRRIKFLLQSFSKD